MDGIWSALLSTGLLTDLVLSIGLRRRYVGRVTITVLGIYCFFTGKGVALGVLLTYFLGFVNAWGVLVLIFS